jgi:hypothetical protein
VFQGKFHPELNGEMLLRARDKVLTLSVATVKTAAIAGGSQITRSALGIP